VTDGVRAFAGIGAAHGRRAGEVAIAWVLRHPAVAETIVGGRNARPTEATKRPRAGGARGLAAKLIA
jgi:aryl-alcohol dehydrogenase-like predicted oxidoreductase